MMFTVLGRVFSNARYTQLAILVAFIVLSAAILLPNFDLLRQVFYTHSISVTGKLSFLGSIYASIFTNFSTPSAIFTAITAILFGINVALMVYYVRRRQSVLAGKTAEWSSVGGFVSGAMGIGCAACGSVILTSILTTFGAGGLLALLPLHGAEFGLLSMILLTVAIRQLAKRINDPLVCPLN